MATLNSKMKTTKDQCKIILDLEASLFIRASFYPTNKTLTSTKVNTIQTSF